MTVVEDSAVPSFDTLEDLADELPSNSPRYIVVSYELTDPKDGRVSRPLFALNYNPGTGAPEMKTLHASGLSLFQRAADVARVRHASLAGFHDDEELLTSLDCLRTHHRSGHRDPRRKRSDNAGRRSSAPGLIGLAAGTLWFLRADLTEGVQAGGPARESVSPKRHEQTICAVSPPPPL